MLISDWSSDVCSSDLSARVRRETYDGPWLPEPVVEAEDEQDDVTLPLMLALERLSPLERAAFLLHDVFGQSFDEIAAVIGRDPAACRQLAARSEEHTSELQSLMSKSYAVFCLKKKNTQHNQQSS